MERTCGHGIGHPDPDHMAYALTKPGRVGEYESGVHGCDGCCIEVRYVICWCGYEREAGQECGLPCA